MIIWLLIQNSAKMKQFNLKISEKIKTLAYIL